MLIDDRRGRPADRRKTRNLSARGTLLTYVHVREKQQYRRRCQLQNSELQSTSICHGIPLGDSCTFYIRTRVKIIQVDIDVSGIDTRRSRQVLIRYRCIGRLDRQAGDENTVTFLVYPFTTRHAPIYT